MWRGMATSGFDPVEPVRWTDQAGKVESSGEPFMAPSGHVTREDIGDGESEGRIINLGCLSQGACRCWVVNTTLELFAERKMSGRSPLSREGSKEGCNYSRCNKHSVGGLGKEAKESNSLGGDGDNSGERWFNMENSQVERRSMFHLECELDASLQFEYGGGQGGGPRPSQLWVTCIVLGRLFRERLVLGQVVKLYARFQ